MSFGRRTTPSEVLGGLDLTDRVLLVTGANTGIGFETAKALAGAGARVYCGCRTDDKAQSTLARIRQAHPSADVRPFVADLGSLSEVRQAARALEAPALHGVICNAGVYGGGYQETTDGFERTVGICHLAHFVLVQELTQRLVAGAPSRVAVVASHSHKSRRRLNLDDVPPSRERYSDLLAYDTAKLCNVLFAHELDRRLRDQGVRANSLHPGTMVSTDLDRSSGLAKVGMALFRPFSKTLEQAAATSVWAVAHPDLEGVGGEYLVDCRVGRATALGRDPEAAERLWDHTERLLQGVTA